MTQRNIEFVNGLYSINDFVAAGAPSRIYSIAATAGVPFAFGVSSSFVKAELYYDANNNGVADAGELVDTSNVFASSRQALTVSSPNTGTYLVKVTGTNLSTTASTDFTLTATTLS